MQIKFYWRSLKYLFNRFILNQKYLTADAILNIKITFPIEDAVGRHIYKLAIWEPHITALIRELSFSKGDIVADVGANLGWYSILIDKISPKGVKIYAFEPDPINFKLLLKNIELNRAMKVVPINKAVGEKPGIQKLYLYPDKNRGRHSLLPINKYETIEVEVISLDEFFKDKEFDNLKLLKIDVEGYEYFVLKGSLNTLQKTQYVILEYAPQYMLKGNIQPKEFKKFLNNLPFKVLLIGKNTLKEIKPENLPEEGENLDLFLIRQ